MGKFSSIVLGTVTGVSVALFLTSKKGKEMTEKVVGLLQDIQENPDTVKGAIVSSISDLSNQASDKVKDVRSKIGHGDLMAGSAVNFSKRKVKNEIVTDSFTGGSSSDKQEAITISLDGKTEEDLKT